MPEHPFYAPTKGWTEAVHLRAGDKLLNHNGEMVVVEQVQHEILEAPVVVYNFEVQDYHTYFVGTNGVLVHNACGFTPDQKAVVELAKQSKKTGIRMSDAKILVDWGNKYGLPSRIDMGHALRGNEATRGIHAHVGPINHIRIFMD